MPRLPDHEGKSKAMGGKLRRGAHKAQPRYPDIPMPQSVGRTGRGNHSPGRRAPCGDIRAQDEARLRRKELIESMATRPFWHYCEVCGKREFLTAKDAFDSGWDYPPRMGHFGLLGPRSWPHGGGSGPSRRACSWKSRNEFPAAEL